MSDSDKNLDRINTGLYSNLLFELGLTATFIQDLLFLDEISIEDIECLSDKLKAIPIKPEEGIYSTLVQTFDDVGITNNYHQKALYAILTKLPFDRIKRIISSIKSWVEACPENAVLFPKEKLESVNNKLLLLIQPYKFLELDKKYKQLRRATGLHLEDIDTVLDIRPVIEKEQYAITDFIFNTTLKFLVRNEFGKKQVLEIVLDEETLKPFIVKLLALKTELEFIKKELV